MVITILGLPRWYMLLMLMVSSSSAYDLPGVTLLFDDMVFTAYSFFIGLEVHVTCDLFNLVVFM